MEANPPDAQVTAIERQSRDLVAEARRYRRGTFIDPTGRILHSLHLDVGSSYRTPASTFRGGRSGLKQEQEEESDSGRTLLRAKSNMNRVRREVGSIPVTTVVLSSVDPFAEVNQIALGRAFPVGFVAVLGLDVHWRGDKWLVTGAQWELPSGKTLVTPETLLEPKTGIIALAVPAAYPDLKNVLTRSNADLVEAEGIATGQPILALIEGEPTASMNGVDSYTWTETQRAHLTTIHGDQGASPQELPDEDFTSRTSREVFPVALVMAPSEGTNDVPVIFPLVGGEAPLNVKPYFGGQFTARKEPSNE